MKQKSIILIAIILLFAACQEITKEDLQGNWHISKYGQQAKVNIRQMVFSEEKVEWTDDYLLKQSGTYNIENGKLIIKRTKDSFEFRTKIESLIADTLIVFDSLIYLKNHPLKDLNYDEYNLVGVATNQYLSEEDRDFGIIHFYKLEDNKLKIRLGQKIKDYKDIPIFLDGRHSMKSGVLVFIGEGITLQDLKELYMEFATINHYRVFLVTKKEGISDHHIFYDKFEIWREELEKHTLKIKIPLPPPDVENKRDYLIKGGKEIKVDKVKDVEVFDKLMESDKYIFSINQDMSIEDYIKVKSRIKEFRNKRYLETGQRYQIITEIKQR